MGTDADRIASLEKLVIQLGEAVVQLQKDAAFAHAIAGQAMFTLARLAPRLEKTGIVASAEQGGITAVTHALFLKHEQNPLFSEEDRESVRQWREQLGREA